MQGALAEGVLSLVLRTLYVGRKTGLLHITRGEERGSVCFVEGSIVYGETNITECRMGETLVRHGLLNYWELERAREVKNVTGRRLGQVLVDLGNLDASGLEDALALQVREVLLTVFSWRDGSYRLDEHDPAFFRGYDRPLPLSMGEVILDAVWSITDPEVIRFGLGNLDRVLIPANDPLLRFQRITLNSSDGFLLSRVDGGSTASQILRTAPLSADEAMRSLFGLVCTGMVEWVPAPPAAAAPPPRRSLRDEIVDAYERVRGQQHHEVLGVSAVATPAEIQEAFIRLAKLYHPDSHHAPELVDLKGKLETLFQRVNEAHQALTRKRDRKPRSVPETPPPPAAAPARAAAPAPAAPAPARAAPAPAPAPSPRAAPPPVEPAPAAKTVDDLVDQAAESLGAGRYWEALVAVDQAMPEAQGRLRRRAHILRAQALLKGEGGRRAAEEELKAALQEDRGNAEAHFFLGTIYQGGGAKALAAAAYKRALDLKPRYPEALQALATLETGGPDEPKSPGLRGLFKRS
jgi:tetratricopeptide (TPR) repeat protein